MFSCSVETHAEGEMFLKRATLWALLLCGEVIYEDLDEEDRQITGRHPSWPTAESQSCWFHRVIIHFWSLSKATEQADETKRCVLWKHASTPYTNPLTLLEICRVVRWIYWFSIQCCDAPIPHRPPPSAPETLYLPVKALWVSPLRPLIYNASARSSHPNVPKTTPYMPPFHPLNKNLPSSSTGTRYGVTGLRASQYRWGG